MKIPHLMQLSKVIPQQNNPSIIFDLFIECMK